MIIEVTQEDIDKAASGRSRCPIARAVRRTFKCSSGVSVYRHSTQVERNTYTNLPEMIRFIDAFDSKGFVEPQKFEVNWDKIK